MNLRKLEDVIPLISTTIGGFTIGVLARNGWVDWTGETLVAGALGLAGGWLAYKAATDHRRATENRNEYIFQANHMSDLWKAQKKTEQMLTKDYGDRIILGADINLEAIIKLVDKAARFPSPLPPELSHELETLCGIIPYLHEANNSISGVYNSSGDFTGIKVDNPDVLRMLLAILSNNLKAIETHFFSKILSEIH